MIIPSLSFNCYGNVTRVVFAVTNADGDDLPVFQIWRPTLSESSYTNVGQTQLIPDKELPEDNELNFPNARFENPLPFKPGDVIGYYQPSNPRHLLYSIEKTGFVSYSNNASDVATTININNTDYDDNELMPFVRVYFGKCIRSL